MMVVEIVSLRYPHFRSFRQFVASGTLTLVLISCGPSNNASVDVSMPPSPDTTLTPVFAVCDGDTCSCSCDDPFEPRVRVKGGDFDGMCLNTCRQRSVALLSDSAARANGFLAESLRSQFQGSVISVMNVSHYDTLDTIAMFCVALVSLDAVREAIVQLEFAGGQQAHAQMRFLFDSAAPAILIPQRNSLAGRVYYERELFFSAEALAPPGTRYKGDYAMRRQYHQSFRLETKYPRARKMIRELRHPVAQYRIDSKSAGAGAILLAAVELGDSHGLTLRYHTVQRNCILEVFHAIDRALAPPWYRRPLLVVTNRTLFMPTRAPKHLRYRGLAPKDGSFRLPNFEDELGWSEAVDTRLKEELLTAAARW